MSRVTHPIAIGLGANLGDPVSAVQQAAARVCESLGEPSARVSPLYWTSPVGGPEQPPFVNAALVAFTVEPPLSVLDRLLAIEAQFGRRRREPWGPRTLDLDLLLYSGCKVSLPRLQVPHPRLHLRGFALVPLVELAPDWVHPGLGRTIRELCAQWKASAPQSEQVQPLDVLPHPG